MGPSSCSWERQGRLPLTLRLPLRSVCGGDWLCGESCPAPAAALSLHARAPAAPARLSSCVATRLSCSSPLYPGAWGGARPQPAALRSEVAPSAQSHLVTGSLWPGPRPPHTPLHPDLGLSRRLNGAWRPGRAEAQACIAPQEAAQPPPWCVLHPQEQSEGGGWAVPPASPSLVRKPGCPRDPSSCCGQLWASPVPAHGTSPGTLRLHVLDYLCG